MMQNMTSDELAATCVIKDVDTRVVPLRVARMKLQQLTNTVHVCSRPHRCRPYRASPPPPGGRHGMQKLKALSEVQRVTSA